MGSEPVQPCEQGVDCADGIEGLVPTEHSLASSSNRFNLVNKYADECVFFLLEQRCNAIKDSTHEFPAFAKELAAQ